MDRLTYEPLECTPEVRQASAHSRPGAMILFFQKYDIDRKMKATNTTAKMLTRGFVAPLCLVDGVRQHELVDDDVPQSQTDSWASTSCSRSEGPPLPKPRPTNDSQRPIPHRGGHVPKVAQ